MISFEYNFLFLLPLIVNFQLQIRLCSTNVSAIAHTCVFCTRSRQLNLTHVYTCNSQYITCNCWTSLLVFLILKRIMYNIPITKSSFFKCCVCLLLAYFTSCLDEMYEYLLTQLPTYDTQLPFSVSVNLNTLHTSLNFRELL